VQRKGDDSSIYLLTYFLVGTVKVYPDVIKEYILGKTDNRQADFLKLLLSKVRGRHYSNYLF
jgi:hypothetical protein